MAALTDYRNFIRTAIGGFNGVTVETAVYSQLRQVWTTPTTTAVGRFTPASLNRYNIVSVVRVMLQGVIAPGDAIRVRDSAGQIRFTRAASLETSGWFFMGPEDVLEIEAAGATAADILVNDLTDEQLQEWILSEITAGGQIIPVGQSSITIVASQVLPDWDGHLIAFVDAPLACTVTLPPLANIPLDAKVTLIRIANVGLPTLVTDTPATDEVNGRVGAAVTPYNLRSVGDAITYTRVPDGWTRAFGDQVMPQIVSAADPLPIPPFQGGTLYVESQSVLAGHQILLDPLADYREGCRIMVRCIAASVANLVVPTAPDLINGSPTLNIPPNATALIENAGGMWVAIISDPLNSQIIPAPAPVGPVDGRVVVYISLAVDGDVTLPPLADTPEGSEIIFIRADGAGSGIPRIVADNALDEINGRAGLVAGEYYLRSNSESITYLRVPGGWARKQGEQAPPVITSAVNPIVVPPWTGGTLYLIDEAPLQGNVTQLPSLAAVREGCRLVILAQSPVPGTVHSLSPVLGERINGLLSPFLYTSHEEGRSVLVVEHAGTMWSAVANTEEVLTYSSIAAPGVVDTVGSQQVVRVSLAADGDITLPDPVTLPKGSRITFVRTGGAGIPRIITDNALTEVNGIAGIVATQFFLTSTGKSVTYVAWGSVGGLGVGWTREQEWDQQQLVTISGAGIIPSIPGELIVDYDGGLNNNVVLPALASVPLSASIYMYRSGVGTPTISADNAADLINGTAAAGGNTWALRQSGESVLYVRVPGGWWRNTPIVFTGVTSAGAIAASEAREQFYEMTGGAGQALTLPALTRVDTGTSIYVFNNTGAAHSFVPNGTDEINGANAAWPDAAQDRTQIVSMGATLGWITITSA